MGCTFKTVFICCFLTIIKSIQNAPVTDAPVFEMEQLKNIPNTNKTQNISSVSDLIQLQTNAIKKILSSTASQVIENNDENKKNSKSNCEDTEIIKNNQDNEEKKEDILLRGDLNEKSYVLNGRNLINLDATTSTSSPVMTSEENQTEKQNYVLVPCIKRIINSNGTRRITYEEISAETQNVYHQEKSLTTTEAPPQNQNAYYLEKVYSPNGYFLYYMYKLRNTNPYPTEYISPTTSVPITTSPSTTSTSTTSTTTENINMAASVYQMMDPVYREKLKFIVQMPYKEPEQVSPEKKFDQYAYYPPDMQPSYINAPQPYTPSFHMIRALVIPNKYLNWYNNDQQSANNFEN